MVQEILCDFVGSSLKRQILKGLVLWRLEHLGCNCLAVKWVLDEVLEVLLHFLGSPLGQLAAECFELLVSHIVNVGL